MMRHGILVLLSFLLVAPAFLLAADDTDYSAITDIETLTADPYTVSYDDLYSSDSDSETYTDESSMDESRRPPRPGLSFQGFLLGSDTYEIVELALDQNRGFIRIGSSMYGLSNLAVAKTDEATSTSTGDRQVVAQFQASLVTVSTVESSDDTSTTSVGTIQGNLVQCGTTTTSSSSATSDDRPRGPHGPTMIVEGYVSTDATSGTILCLSGHHGGGPGGHRPPRGDGQEFTGEEDSDD